MIFQIPDTHPVWNVPTNTITDWAEWKELWAAATRFEQKLGLLHCGFTVFPSHENYKQAEYDRLAFYLEMADQHARGVAYFMRGDDNEEIGSRRQALTHKAFAVLAQNVFRNSVKNEYQEPSWLRLVLNADVLHKLLWFFRIDEKIRIPNLDDPFSAQGMKVPTEIAKKFIVEVATLGWKEPRYNIRYDCCAEIHQYMKGYQVQLLDILLGMGYHNLFLNQRSFPLNEACWNRLTQLAYLPRSMWTCGKDGEAITEKRMPVSIEEAAANNSAEALLVHQLRMLEGEYKRFIALQEATRQNYEAQLRLQRLEH